MYSAEPSVDANAVTGRVTELARHPGSIAPSIGVRLPGIDVVRCIAAGAVLVSHVFLTHPASSKSCSELLTACPSQSELGQLLLLSLGNWGVGLFFVLSGLCIHLPNARVLKTSLDFQLPIRRYYMRRFTRIYPPHLIALLLSIGVAALLPNGFFGNDSPISVTTPWQFAAHIMMIHSFFPSARYSGNGVLWTISIETHFYLFYPLLLRLRRSMRFETIVVLLLIASVVSKQFAKVILPPDYAYLWGQNFVGRYWEWALGCVVAERLVTAPPSQSRWRDFLLLTLFSYALTLGLHHLPRGGALIEHVRPFVFAPLIYMGARLPPARTSLYDWVVAGGLRSYSLYLTHPIVMAVVCVATTLLGASYPIQWLASSIASLAITVLFFNFVERPYLVRASKLKAVALSRSP